jgi:uncharacterized phage-associated protein
MTGGKEMERMKSSSRWHKGDREDVTVCSYRELRKHHSGEAYGIIEYVGRITARFKEFTVYPSLESFAGLMLEEQTSRMDESYRELFEKSECAIDDASLRRTARMEIAKHRDDRDCMLWSNGKVVVAIRPARKSVLKKEEELAEKLEKKDRPKKGFDYSACTKEAPYTAVQIAEYIVFWCHMERVPISSMKAQALLYFIQGRFLAKRGYPCFLEPIHVTPYGPMVMTVKKAYSVYGTLNIPCTDTFDQFSDIGSDDMMLLDGTLDGLGTMSESQLKGIIAQQSPWIDANEREEITEDSRIPLRNLLEFFSQ